MRVLLICAGLFVLAGCSTSPQQYNWGPYEGMLFTHFHEPAGQTEQLQLYLDHVRAGEAGERPLGPGMFAEAGTFLLEQGDLAGAREFYELEARHWPESRPFMETLLVNLPEEN